MKNRQTKVLVAVLLATFSISGCGMLKGLIPGMGLTDIPENSLFMTSNESGSSQLPFQIHTSNGRLENPDGGKLYGHY